MVSVEEQGYAIDFDSKTGVLTATYGEILNGRYTAEVYSACLNILADEGVENVRGVIFDFRQVKVSEKDNLRTAQSSSYRANKKVDMSNLPVALVATSPLQQAIVKVSVKVGADQHRKRIVSTSEEALAFFTEWHESN